MYRFLLSRRWIGLAVFVIALSALCFRLGFWQWHRMEHKQEVQQSIRTHLSADPVPLTSAVPFGEPVPDAAEWTRVRVTGSFDVEHQVTVKFTTRAGAPGADVVTPLVMRDGTAVLINRGWMSTNNDAARPRHVPAPPRGEVTIEGWLRPDSRADRIAVVPIDGQIRAISSRALQSHVGKPLAHGFINQQQPQTTPLQAEPAPKVSRALNFFYALQWWFFAGLSLVGYFWFARAEAAEASQAKATRSA